MEYKVMVVSLGCNKNLVDSETMMGYLVHDGFVLTDRPDEAEIIIVNTCGFIESAKKEAIATIFEMAQYKQSGRCKALLATGCLAKRYPDALMNDIPELDGIMGVYDYDKIIHTLHQALHGQRPCELSGQAAYLDHTQGRVLATPSYMAYLKIAEGCVNRCHYCAIPSIRGEYVSRDMESLIAEAEALHNSGVKELILTAQDTTRYGEDKGENALVELLERLEGIGFTWIRILYAYPSRVSDKLLDFMDRSRVMCHYLDIPIQHTQSNMLRAMNRHYNQETVKRIYDKVKAYRNDWALRTTVIVGYPGETARDFEHMVKFLTERPFDQLGAFMFSPEEGTVAEGLAHQVRSSTKQVRYDSIMLRQGELSHKANQHFVGRELLILAEGFDEESGMYYGRSEFQAPDVDGRVFFSSQGSVKPGDFKTVKINEAFAYDLFGEASD